MFSDIITQNGLTFAMASPANDFMIVSELPDEQIARLSSPGLPQAIALLQGDDYLVNDAQGRILLGHQGNDTIIGNSGNDTIYGGQNDDYLNGGSGDDLLFGNRGNDTIYGGSGNDTIYGGVGNDWIVGGSGNNVLSGDRGLDTLTGGSGANQFILQSSTLNQDLITDFKPGIDKLRVPDGVTIADLRIKQSDTSTLILLDGQTVATLENVDVESITTRDFIGELGAANHADIQLDLGETGSNLRFEQQVLELVNQERVREDLQPLRLNPLLTQAARTHSTNMALQDFFSHTGIDGSNLTDRIRATGFTLIVPFAENMAAGHTTPELVVEGWMDSPGHRDNILNPDFTQIGVGHYFLENDTGDLMDYNHYWTKVFSGG
ncbi:MULTISPECIES: CAP domain-containing protein [Limnospira]|uniref:SCP domain-containing protein n=1 Tax=Limnospira indica PCC 8005 TaxID=376219 RepID=A0A9P1KDI8_9CYAN|nr:CAP domain-containing protein [Limnospira indica]CDM94021.1 conserved hypothetical protein [Limnospira indica PCC 8005]